MFGCPSKVGLSKTPTLNEILKVLQKEEDLQAHLNDKPSDNIPDNVNSYSNVNSLEDNNSNDIPVPIWIVNTNALYVILYFKQMNKTNTHVNFVQNQTEFRENG